jgi:CheY-like chemotaxis protein
VRKPGKTDRQFVLIVDDDELVRWSAAEGLKESGYSVEVAANAREALHRCPNAAAALLDHDLPDVDGLALADTLRRRHPRCAIVLMTADPSPELRRRARERGVVQVLGKPFSLEDLVDAIRDAQERTLGSPTPPLGLAAGADGEPGNGSWQTEAPHR